MYVCMYIHMLYVPMYIIHIWIKLLNLDGIERTRTLQLHAVKIYQVFMLRSVACVPYSFKSFMHAAAVVGVKKGKVTATNQPATAQTIPPPTCKTTKMTGSLTNTKQNEYSFRLSPSFLSAHISLYHSRLLLGLVLFMK